MNSLNQNSIEASRWQTYKQLELLPDAVANPIKPRNLVKSGLNVLWRSLLGLLIDELVEEQQVEYLDRCWSLNEFGEADPSSSALRRLWVLME